MNILIYGSAIDKEIIIQHMKSQPWMAYRQIYYMHTDDYEEYIHNLEHREWNLVIVMIDDAAGMEGVYAAKNICPHIPVLWFSNDKNFVAQSYRLGVTYFGVKPVEERVMKLAMERCRRKEEYV